MHTDFPSLRTGRRWVQAALGALLLIPFGSGSQAQADDRPTAKDLWTPWLTDGDGPGEYHDHWAGMARRGYYPVCIEGRTVDLHSEYRAFYIPVPEKPYDWKSYHGLDVGGYFEAVLEMAGLGYELVSWHYFFDEHGEIRFQVSWLKTRESFRTNPTYITGDSLRKEIDWAKFPAAKP